MSQDFSGDDVKYAIRQVREKSPILKEMEDKGEIRLLVRSIA